MRVFAVSDVHLEFVENARWLDALSRADFLDDVLILGGDVAEETALLAHGLRAFIKCFRTVLYVPGNHELWIAASDGSADSLEKFARVCVIAADCGASMAPLHEGALSIVPLLSWYDFSFGEPSADLLARWMDFQACRWPAGADAAIVNEQFLARNELPESTMRGTVISFSHFLPRIDVMPPDVPPEHQMLYPVLGTRSLERQVRRLRSVVHVYGHSHLNRDVTLDGTRYINNALGYPAEGRIAARRLLCVHDTA
jgi:predicted phosphodiesterase